MNRSYALGRLRPGQLNKTETAYALTLEARKRIGEIEWFQFEGIKLRLADSTFYTPDFFVMLAGGELQCHEVKGYSPDDKKCLIYSYRDKHNMPHATFEVRKGDESINQIKGKGNGPIHPKYIHPILAFLKSIGMEIRPNDMQNLGYYHMPVEHLEYLRLSAKAASQLTMINGEAYARA